MNIICSEICCFGILNALISGVCGITGSSILGLSYMCSSGITGCLMGCGGILSSSVNLLSGLIGGVDLEGIGELFNGSGK